MRLIDADVVIEKVMNYCKDDDGSCVEANADIRELLDEIENLPTIQPEPQEGYWIRRGCGLDIECKCSVCGYKDFVEPHDIYWFKRNYCPNCGARIKGATP